MNHLERPGLPYAVQIELTSHCNLKCKMCPLTTESVPSSLTPGHMSESTWEEVVALAGKTKQAIVSGFGEPLVNPRCLPLLEELDEMGVGLSLATNGTALTPGTAAKLAALRHPIHVNVSIDSPDPEIYRDVRGGDVHKALKGLENLMAVIDPRQVSVSSVLMRQNMASLRDLPPILARLGVGKYVLQSFIDYNPELGEQGLLDDPEASGHLDAIRRACESHGVRLLFTLPDRLDLELEQPVLARQRYYDKSSSGNTTKQCLLPWELPFVDKDGRVFPCCYASTSRSSEMGDLRRQSMEEVWHGEAYRRFRANLLGGEAMPAICRGCTAVPLGEHPLHLYSAQVLLKHSGLSDPANMRLVVRNTGGAAWTRETQVFIGTAHPRDRPSAYYHPSWHTPNRITTFTEDVVEPGATATFEFETKLLDHGTSESFQILVESRCWLPSTDFEIRSNSFYGRLRHYKNHLTTILTPQAR